MRNAKIIKAHVYLEGYEVNFLNLNIVEAEGSAPMAEITVAAYPGILNLLPKTVCIVTAELPLRDDSGNYLFSTVDGNSVLTYAEYVIFYGQFNGFNYNRTGFQSAMTLAFSGFTAEWDKNPIVPVAASIPTLLQSVFLGVSSVGNGQQNKYGIFYEGYPSVLLSYTEILNGNFGGMTPWINNVNSAKQKMADNLNTMLTDREYYSYRLNSESNGDIFSALVSHIKNAMAAATPIQKADSAKVSLADSLKYLFENLYHESTQYLFILSRATNTNIMTQYINSEVLRELVLEESTVDFFKSGMQGLKGTQPISAVLQLILPNMFYDYIEFAAPVLIPMPEDRSKMTLNKIMVKPKSAMFSPIVNNIIFDDDLVQANITRMFDNEPTRLINMTKPLPTADSSGNLVVNSLMATIAPQGILATDVLTSLQESSTADKLKYDKALRNNASPEDLQKFIESLTGTQDSEYSPTLASGKLPTAAQIKNKQILGYTYEEVLRGIIPTMYTDPYNSEYSFILNELKKQNKKIQSASDINTDALIGSLDIVYNIFHSVTTSGDAFVRYSSNLANFLYHEARRKPRTAQLNVDFSPFRVVGFPALICIKETGPFVANLAQNQISISPNGAAQQVLTFTHVSQLNVDESYVQNNLETLADAYQDISTVKNTDLNYFSEFEPKSVGKNLYIFANGVNPASLYDFCEFTPGLAPTSNTRITAQCANNLMKAYEEKTDEIDAEKFVYKLTHKRLTTMPQLMSALANDEVGFNAQALVDRINITDSSAPRPFLDVRQQAVQKIFVSENPQFWWAMPKNSVFVKGIAK
jgi:hypothetical protein